MTTPNINEMLKLEPVITNLDTPIGRVNETLKGNSDKLYLQKVKLNNVKYDSGGACWGFHENYQSNVYCAFNPEGTIKLFVWAGSRKEAKKRLYTVFGVHFIS